MTAIKVLNHHPKEITFSYYERGLPDNTIPENEWIHSTYVELHHPYCHCLGNQSNLIHV